MLSNIQNSNNMNPSGDVIPGFCNYDYVENVDIRKTQSDYIFKMFSSAVSRKSDLQNMVALSLSYFINFALKPMPFQKFLLLGDGRSTKYYY